MVGYFRCQSDIILTDVCVIRMIPVKFGHFQELYMLFKLPSELFDDTRLNFTECKVDKMQGLYK